MRTSTCALGHFYDSSEFGVCPPCLVLNGDASPAAGQQGSGPESELENAREARRFRASLGPAPDGLPWDLTIERGPLADELLGKAANELGFLSTVDMGNTPIRALAQSVHDLLNERDFALVDIDGERVDCYVANQSIPSLIGPTLLEQLIGTPTRVTMPLRPGATAFGVRESSSQAGRIPAARLGIPLNRDRMVVVKRRSEPGLQDPFSLCGDSLQKVSPG